MNKDKNQILSNIIKLGYLFSFLLILYVKIIIKKTCQKYIQNNILLH